MNKITKTHWWDNSRINKLDGHFGLIAHMSLYNKYNELYQRFTFWPLMQTSYLLDNPYNAQLNIKLIVKLK